VITAAALCPAPPLLVRGLTGAAEVLPDLRRACLDAIAELATSEPYVIAVVGTADRTGRWDASAALDLHALAPGSGYLATGRSAPAGRPTAGATGLPLTLGVGAWLLGASGYRGERILHGLGQDASVAQCADAGATIGAARERVALLVMADGSARRTRQAPGYFDERCESFDAEVERAIREGDLGALLRIDSELARELMATGRPAWQALAGAMEGLQVASEVRFCDDPFGVAYLVASFRLVP
jgi:hypothetical protein